MDWNQVTLGGRLTRDVELKYTNTNKAVANIGLAVSNKYKAQDGTKKEDVVFLDCEAWGATAESMSQYLSKGRAVFICGRLKMDVWDDKQSGTKRSKIKVVVDTWQFVGPKPTEDGQQVEQVEVRRAAPSPTAARGAGGTVYEPIDDTDLPF